MNLRAIANSITQAINPNVQIWIKQSAGFVIGPGAKQVPQYGAKFPVQAQVQPLNTKELAFMAGMNIQGQLKSVYIYGVLNTPIRSDQTGGDLVLIDNHVWKVVNQMEDWPDWCRVVVQQQTDSAAAF